MKAPPFPTESLVRDILRSTPVPCKRPSTPAAWAREASATPYSMLGNVGVIFSLEAVTSRTVFSSRIVAFVFFGVVRAVFVVVQMRSSLLCLVHSLAFFLLLSFLLW